VSAYLSQEYKELTPTGAYNSATTHANYYYLPLSFKYQTHRLNSMNKHVPQTLSAVIGTHYGRLQSSNIESNLPSIDANVTDDKLIQQEIGAFMGADYNIYIHSNMHLTLGGRVAAGTDVNNLSAPFATGTPYNLQVGVRVGLSYRFASRQYKWRHGIY